MRLHKSVANKIEAQINLWEQQLDSLKNAANDASVSADSAEAKHKEDVAQKMKAVQKKIENAKDSMASVEDAGLEKLQIIRSNLKLD